MNHDFSWGTVLDTMAVELEVTCLCGRTTDMVQPQAKIPIQTSICHCDSCRHNIGSLYYSSIPIVASPKSISNLQVYRSSQNLIRYFCGQCGTQIYYQNLKSTTWYVSTGAVDHVTGDEQVSDQLETIVEQRHVEDTIDGGLAICLPTPSITSRGSHFEGTRQPSLDIASGRPPTPPRRNRLAAACHCGSVSFDVTRPNEASRACSSPWADLLRPYHSYKPDNHTDEKWWIHGDRFLAGTCACRTCRLAFGSPIVSWAFIPKVNVRQMDGSPWDFQSKNLSTYESSPGKWRVFCQTCGASCFWHCEDRPDLLDVSVGILRAGEGARAENWLRWWTDRVSFSEDAFDKDLIRALEAGLKNLEVPQTHD